MTHLSRPALRRSCVSFALAAALALGAVAPSVADAAPSAAPAAPASSLASLTSITTLAWSGTSRWSTGRSAADDALSKVGTSYRWGGTGPTAFDCSGLTSTAWAAAGVTIPRTSREQADGLRSVQRSELRPGDIVLFGSPVRHVEMYVGDGRLVGASTSLGRVSTTELRYRSNIVGYARP